MKILFKACTVKLGEWVTTSEHFLIIVSQYFVPKVYVYSKNILFYWWYISICPNCHQ